ncbi:TrmB family transcriptional regulator [Nanoarchaeota archaeon]
MVNQKLLEEIGLTGSESKIYLVLLEKGASLAGSISRNTGIHRRSVYDSIERLIQKGLVSYIKKNNRKFFEAADPERLLEILHKKEEDIQEALPQLKMLQRMSSQKNETLFFRGKAALKTAFEDQLDSKEILVWGATPKADEILQFYFPHFEKNRAKKKIKSKMIFNETDKKNDYIKKIPLSEIRFVPKKVQSDTAVHVYGRNVCIVNWQKDPIAIIIREEAIAEGFRNYFNFMWEMAKK